MDFVQTILHAVAKVFKLAQLYLRGNGQLARVFATFGTYTVLSNIVDKIESSKTHPVLQEAGSQSNLVNYAELKPSTLHVQIFTQLGLPM